MKDGNEKKGKIAIEEALAASRMQGPLKKEEKKISAQMQITHILPEFGRDQFETRVSCLLTLIIL